jgi:choline dehydrogenase
LACNLARACHRVLLIEAGGDGGDRPDLSIPALHAKASEDPAILWQYFVSHYDDPSRQAQDSKYVPGKGIFYPRAATLGGCTAHNAMITVYPHASDWDHIAQLTRDPSWSSQNMRQYFERIESCRYLPRGTPGHGFQGWLSTEVPDTSLVTGDSKLQQVVLAAAETVAKGGGRGLFARMRMTVAELMETLRGDLNSPSPRRDGTEGLFTIPLATKGGKRVGPRDYILQTVAEDFPLTVQTHALVTRVLFEDSRRSGGALWATGVEYLPGAHLYQADPNASLAAPAPIRVTARREVILSAGAYNTPQLLKLSGVGPAAELAALGVPLVLDLPGVGANLQDRYEVGVVSELPSDFSVTEKCSFKADEDDPCLSAWKLGYGPYTTSGGVVALVKRSHPSEANPDLFMFAVPAHFRGYFPGYSRLLFADKRHLSWVVLKAHTRNTAGQVRLASRDPRVPPQIYFHSFDEGSADQGQDAADLKALVAGVELVREINGVANWMKVLPGRVHSVEQLPGPAISSEADIAAFVKREAWGHHASCSCKIGADGDPMAVLDGNFKVRGVQGLRVVDASVFPRIPGFFIAAPIYMISEKATDVVLADARRGAGPA